MLFKNASTFTKQGDIGEARAIYEYTKLGYTVSRTIFDSARYDLIIDDGQVLKRVQVKTSTYKTKSGAYEVGLKTSGGNTRENTVRLRNEEDYDILFILTAEDRCWSIPIEALDICRYTVTVGNKKYSKYELRGSGEVGESQQTVNLPSSV